MFSHHLVPSVCAEQPSLLQCSPFPDFATSTYNPAFTMLERANCEAHTHTHFLNACEALHIDMAHDMLFSVKLQIALTLTDFN